MAQRGGCRTGRAPTGAWPIDLGAASKCRHAWLHMWVRRQAAQRVQDPAPTLTLRLLTPAAGYGQPGGRPAPVHPRLSGAGQ